MSIGRITVDLLAKTGSFETDLQRAAKTAERRAKQIDDALKKAGTAMGVALAAGAAAAAVALKGTIDRMDEMSKAAQKVGLSTEEFSKLSYAAGLADVSMDALAGALGRLTKAQAEALKETSQQARVFEALGIAVKNADGSLRNSSDVLADFADRFRDLQGSPEAMAAGFELFGRSFQDLIPLLKDGSAGIREAGAELESMGGALSGDAGQAAEEFNDNLTRLRTAMDSLVIQVAQHLVPNLVELTDRLVAFTREGENASRIADTISAAFGFVADVTGVVWNKLDGFGKILEGVAAKFVALAEAGRAFATLDWGGVERAMRLSQEGGRMMAEGLAQNLSGTSPGGSRSGPKVRFITGLEGSIDESDRRGLASPVNLGRLQQALAGGEGSKKEKKQVDELAEAHKRINEQLDQQIALFGKTGEAAKLRYELEHGELAKLSPLEKERLIQKAEHLDLLEREREAFEENMRLEKERSEAVKRAIENGNQLISDMQFELSLLGMTNLEREKAIALRYLEADATDAQRQAVAQLAEDLHRAREQTAFMDDFRQSLADTFVAIVDGSKSAKDAFKDFFDNMAAMITRMIAERWIEQLFGAMGTTGQGTSGGNWLGAIFGAMFGGGRANGGPVGMGQTYLVGERGPELFVPRTAGMVIPAPQTAQMVGGRGVTLNQNFYTMGTETRRTSEQKARQAGREAARGLSRTGR